MKYLKNIFLLWLLGLILSGFVYINTINYKKHVEIRDNYVNHPEWIPRAEVSKYTSFGFANLRADFYWLETIQYIWWNAIGSEYKKYLYAITELITELNPYFEHPYVIAQLLLPSTNQRYEDITDTQQIKNTDDAIKIWLKWMDNFCDSKIIENIKWENNLNKIWKNPDYKNPCKSYKIPYYLAYIYYYYKKDPINASLYYKIASANDDTVEWAKSMAAIMAGKWWQREKSIFMFLNIASSLDTKNSVCWEFSKKLNDVSTLVFQNKKIPLTWELVQMIEQSRIATFWKFDWKDNSEQISDMSCMNYLNKANREINLAYLDQANIQYKKENWKNAIDTKELYENKFINFIPTDFQQYKEKNYGIIYEFNDELWYFDYKMWY
jgi:hypothetical protein